MRKYIQNYDRNLERELILINTAIIPVENKQLIFDFKNYNFVRGISVPRILRQSSVLRLISKYFNKTFDELTMKDFEQYIIWIKTNQYSEESIDTYKKNYQSILQMVKQRNLPRKSIVGETFK